MATYDEMKKKLESYTSFTEKEYQDFVKQFGEKEVEKFFNQLINNLDVNNLDIILKKYKVYFDKQIEEEMNIPLENTTYYDINKHKNNNEEYSEDIVKQIILMSRKFRLLTPEEEKKYFTILLNSYEKLKILDIKSEETNIAMTINFASIFASIKNEQQINELVNFKKRKFTYLDNNNYCEYLLSNNEKEIVNEYLRLYRKEGKIPTLDTLKKKMPKLKYNNIVELSEHEFTEQLESLKSFIEVNKIVMYGNMRLVIATIKRYNGLGLDFEDLYSEGILGLQRATFKFDVNRGYKFSTYALWWIKQSITRSLADKAKTIRIPVHRIEKVNRLLRLRKQLAFELGREVKIPELAEASGISVEECLDLLKIAGGLISLDEPIKNNEDNDATLIDFIEDENSVSPQKSAEIADLKQRMAEVLDTLNPREKEVLMLRFGLVDNKEKTLEEVGQIYGVTRERIRQIEDKALRKLRHPSRRSKIEDFLK